MASLSFEDAYRTDTTGRPRSGIGSPSWPKGLGRARDPRPGPPVVGDQPAENVWPDRARLGRDWRRSAG